MAKRPSIAACLMVRDGAEFLGPCLGSLEESVDAIYVTDTGSTDESVSIARSFGATVRFFAWGNNFAAARNESIAEVSEDWILTVDSDDLFPLGEAGKLREHLEPGACAATVLYSAVPGYTPLRATKLFLNNHGAAFEGAIHENLSRWLVEQRAAGWRHLDLDVALTHTGYTPDAMPAKIARNLPLLQQEWDCFGNAGSSSQARKLHLASDLSLALAHSGHHTEAIVFLKGVLSDAADDATAAPASVLQLLINLLWLFGEAKDGQSALVAACRFERSFCSAPAYQLHRGLTELASGNHLSARDWLERFRTACDPLRTDVPVPTEFLGTGWWRAMGLCHMGTRDYSHAADCFKRCCDEEPGNREHELRLLVANRMLAR